MNPYPGPMNLYPGAKVVLADPSNYHPCWPKRQTYSRVVLHVTDGHGRAEPVAEMWQQYQHRSSAHFVVGQDGTVVQCVDLGDVAWHASEANSDSVGVEHCARSPREWGRNDLGLAVSEAQMAASAKLVAWLLRGAGLPADRAHVVGHNEASPRDHHDDCPTGAPGWDWEKIMAAIAKELA